MNGAFSASATFFTLVALHALTHHVARTRLIFPHSSISVPVYPFVPPPFGLLLPRHSLFRRFALSQRELSLGSCDRKKTAGDAGGELFRLNPVAGSPWQRVESADGPYYYNLLTEVELAWQRDNVVDSPVQGGCCDVTSSLGEFGEYPWSLSCRRNVTSILSEPVVQVQRFFVIFHDKLFQSYRYAIKAKPPPPLHDRINATATVSVLGVLGLVLSRASNSMIRQCATFLRLAPTGSFSSLSRFQMHTMV